MTPPLHIVGGGLAGCEAAWQAASRGVPVVLHEMRPLATTPAHVGDSLAELRAALLQAEIDVEEGASPRVSPFADVRDMGGLLQRAGFALPVADVDSITVTYPSALALMQELRGMGESNADSSRRRAVTRRETLLRAAALYAERHGTAEGRIPARFEIIYLTGWRPHDSQPQALRPGSASARLAEALGGTEQVAGESAPPNDKN